VHQTYPITQWDVAEVLEGLGFAFIETVQEDPGLNGRPHIEAGKDVWRHAVNTNLETKVGWRGWNWRVLQSGEKLSEGLGATALTEYFQRFDELLLP